MRDDKKHDAREHRHTHSRHHPREPEKHGATRRQMLRGGLGYGLSAYGPSAYYPYGIGNPAQGPSLGHISPVQFAGTSQGNYTGQQAIDNVSGNYGAGGDGGDSGSSGGDSGGGDGGGGL